MDVESGKKMNKCVWNRDNCSGLVAELEIFKSQIKVPLCKIHERSHDQVMTLHKLGYNVEKMIELSDENREDLLRKATRE